MKILLAGDSISKGYGPGVVERIGNGFEISTLSGNGETSTNQLSRLDEWFVRPKFDFIHLNCGLHDLARDRNASAPRVPLDRYEANLIQIIRRLRGETRSVLAWASTTPVIAERHAARKGFDRCEEDVMAYNDVALRVTGKKDSRSTIFIVWSNRQDRRNVSVKTAFT